MPQAIPASVWRAGKSRLTLLFRAAEITRFTPEVREQCILTALCAPNDGYEVHPIAVIRPQDRDATTSYACILGLPGEGVERLPSSSALLPGPAWVENGHRDSIGNWDIIARFGKVGKKYTPKTTEECEFGGRKHIVRLSDYWQRSLHWTQTPSDVLAAVAHATLLSASSQTPLFSYSKIADIIANTSPIPSWKPDSTFTNPTHIPVRILDAYTEQVVVARVPVEAATLGVYEHLATDFESYLNETTLGPPSHPIEVEYSLDPTVEFPTGNVKDEITLAGTDADKKVKVSIVNVGQPVILVLAESLPIKSPPPEYCVPDIIKSEDASEDEEDSSKENIYRPSDGTDNEQETFVDPESRLDWALTNQKPVLTMHIPVTLNPIPERHSTLEAVGTDNEQEIFVNPEGRLDCAHTDQNPVLTMHMPGTLDAIPELHSTLEAVRAEVVSRWPVLKESDSELSPLICLVGDMDHDGYDTLNDKYVCCCQANLSVRSLSTTEPRKFDTWLPESALRALAVAQGLKGSVAYDAWVASQKRGCGGGRNAKDWIDIERVELSAAHPSGVDEAAAIFGETEQGRRALKLILMKSPRELMRGEIFVPVTHLDTESQLGENAIGGTINILFRD